MLKVVLMDLFPYLIDKHLLYNFIWKNILSNEEYENFQANENISPLLIEDLNEKIISDKFLAFMDNQEVALKIINKFDSKLKCLTKKYFENFKFNDVIEKFFSDAKTSNCDIVLMNNEPDFSEYVHLIKLPNNVYLSDNYENININNLEEKLTDKSIALNEFIYFTNDQIVIEHLLEKGYFCATIDTSSNDSKLIAIDSINDLNFGNLALNFYDKSENSVGEL